MPARASNQLTFDFTEPRHSWLHAPEPVAASAPVSPAHPAEVLALTGLRRMLPEGSVPLLYRKVLSSRWGRVPLRSRLDQLAIVDLELWDGDPATVAVSAHVEGLRTMTKTGMTDDRTAEEIELMLTKPTTWWGMQWVRSKSGPFLWVERRRRWERCAEAA